MTIEEKVLAIWTADAAAIALVPAARFKVPGNWQNLARPYVIQYPIAETTLHTHETGGQAAKLRQWEFYQLSVVADSYSSAKAVVEKMRALFNGPVSGINMQYRGQRWVGDSDVTETKHIAVDFRIAETLT